MRRNRAARHPVRRARVDTMWAPYVTDGQDDPSLIYAGSGDTAHRWISIDSASLKTSATGTLLSTGQSAKLLRFDGYLLAYMDASDSGGAWAEQDHTRLHYWWVKEKLNADAYSGSEMNAAVEKMNPVLQWSNIMRRRDVMKWGLLDVYGPIPDDTGTMSVAIAVPTTGLTVSGYPLTVIANKRNSTHTLGVRVPFPRLPRGGLNLLAGEVLNLYVAGFSLTDTLGSNARPVYGFPRFRMLLSV